MILMESSQLKSPNYTTNKIQNYHMNKIYIKKQNYEVNPQEIEHFKNELKCRIDQFFWEPKWSEDESFACVCKFKFVKELFVKYM